MGRQTGRLGGLPLDLLTSLVAIGLGLFRDASRLPGWKSAAGIATPPPDYLLHPSPAVIVSLHVLGGVVLLGRRHRPYPVGLVLLVMSLVVPLVSAILMTYSVARYGDRLRWVLVLNAGLLLTVLTSGDLLGQIGSTDWQRGDPYTVMLSTVALTALGLYARARRQLIDALLERAVRAEEQARTRAEMERLRERAALAVQLHDDIARHLTVVTMGAGALAVTGPDSGTRDEAEELRRAGERSLSALHQMIRAFSAEPWGPSSSAQERVAGRPALPRALALEALAEALTNADKHAPGAGVEVRLVDDADLIELTVVNEPGAAPDAPGSGVGLVSLRARCEAADGRLEAGPTGDGGWRVHLVLPSRRPAVVG